jgi:hypothetical protein
VTLADPSYALGSCLSPLGMAAEAAKIGLGAVFLNLTSAVGSLFTSYLSAVSDRQYTSWSDAYLIEIQVKIDHTAADKD